MSKGNVPISEAWVVATIVSDALHNAGIKHEICGSLRRGVKKTAGDIDLAVRKILKTAEVLKTLGAEVIFPQKSKYTIPKNIDAILSGIKINIYEAAASNWGAMLLFLTGSGLFNFKMRVYARVHGWKLNQYGLWKDDTLLASKSEQAIFKAMGLQNIAPAHREWEEKDSFWHYRLRRK
jgi:DNA polymerase (family X)